MRKLLNQPWFAAVLALAAIAAVATALFPDGVKSKFRGLAASPDDSTDTSASTGGEARVSAWAMVQRIRVPANLRDPFAVKAKPMAVAEKASEPDVVDTVHLSAIWTENGQTLALINDHIYEDGDQIGHLKMESATLDGVWLSHWKGRDFLKLGGDFTLNTPAKQLAQVIGSL